MDDTRRDEDPLSASELQRRAVSGSTWTALTTFLSLPVAFVANAVVARSLGVSNYGSLAFLTAVLGLAGVFANFGFSTAAIQKGSRAETAGRRAEADALLQQSLGFSMLVQLPILMIVVLVLTWGDPRWEAVALGVAVTLTCLLGGASISITIENRTAVAARFVLVLNLVLSGSSVLVALLTESASAVWAVRTLIPAAAIGFNFLLLDRMRRRAVLTPRLPFSLGRDFWRYSLLSWTAGLVATLVFSRSEIFVLQFFHETRALGLFALAFGISAVITAPADAMLHPLMPAVAGVLSSFPERSLLAFDRSTRISALVCGAVAAVVVPTLFLAVHVIYGPGFESAAWLFVPLALVSLFQSVNNPVTAFVGARQRGGLILKASIAALVVDIAFAVALIPPFGAWGAVAANVIGQMVALIWITATEPLAMERGLRGLLRLYRPFLAGVAAGGAALGVSALARPSSATLAAIVAGGVGGVAYFVAVRLTRSGLTVNDRDVFLGAMAGPVQPYVRKLLRPITTPGPG